MPSVAEETPSAMASPNPICPTVYHIFSHAEPMALIAPPRVLDWASMASPKLVSPNSIRYFSISSALFFTSVLTPRNVKIILSPSTLDLIPNSFRRSNSPVTASATASTIPLRSLRIAEAVLPYDFNARSEGVRP